MRAIVRTQGPSLRDKVSICRNILKEHSVRCEPEAQAPRSRQGQRPATTHLDREKEYVHAVVVVREKERTGDRIADWSLIYYRTGVAQPAYIIVGTLIW